MKTQLKILLILIAIIGSGCAGATKKAEPAETPKLTLGETVIKDLKSDWEYESAQKPEDCFKSVEKWKKTKKLESGAEACSTCIKSKQFERAEEVAQELSKRELSYPWGPYYLAVLARTKGQTERALWLTELAQKRGESIGIIHYLRGQILWDQKQYDAAVVAIEKSVALDDSLTPAHLLLGQVYFRDQDHKLAVEHFKKVLRKQSKNIHALRGLAWSLFELKDMEAAYDVFDKLTDLEPENGQNYSIMAQIQENQKKNIEAAHFLYKKLSTKIKSGEVTRNIDPELEMKIKRIEGQLNRKRAVASEKEKS